MGQKKNGVVRRIVQRARFNVKDTVRQAAGEEALPVVEYLKPRKNISEFEIASNIKAEVGWVRQMLYRLQNQNLVTYFRKKDRIKGWYISYWSFNPNGAKYLAVKLEKNRLSDLKERLAREEKYRGLFYLCPNFCSRLVFEEATEHDFKCKECGAVMKHQDNAKTIERLREKILVAKRESR